MAALKPVSHSAMCIAMSAAHPLAGEAKLEVSKLSEETFFSMLLESETESIARMESMLAGYGITPREIKVVPNFQSLLRGVRQGRGMTLCGYFPKAAGAEEIRFFTLEGDGEKPCLFAVWRPDTAPKEVLQFIDSLPELKD